MSNHSGALPPDAPMIMQAIRHEHAIPRPLYMLAEHWFKGYPGMGLLTNKMGVVPPTRERPAAAADERRLALVFPEGRRAPQALLAALTSSGASGAAVSVRTAMARAFPIVPIAVVGAEDAMPIFAHLPVDATAHRADLLPGEPRVPALRARRRAHVPAREVQAFASSSRSIFPATAPRQRRIWPSCRRWPRTSAPRIQAAARLARGFAYVRLVRLGSAARMRPL